MKKIKYIIVIILVLIIITALIVINLNNMFNKEDIEDIIKQNWKGKGILDVYQEITEGDIETAMGIILPWNEKTITQKYIDVDYKNKIYEALGNKAISSDKIGEKLETVTVSSYDIYTNKKYSIEATIFKIIGLSEQCVIAVQFDGENDYYGYINYDYAPETLGDFVRDFNFKDEVIFEIITYNCEYTNSKGEKRSRELEFYYVSNEKIWEILFDDLNAKNVYNRQGLNPSDNLRIKLYITINIPVLGIKRSIALLDEGLMLTNIGNPNVFYIGEEKVQNFINYVIENYYAYRTIYVK